MEYSQKVQNLLRNSREEAIRLGNNFLSIDHFCLGLIRENQCLATDILTELNCDIALLKKTIEQELMRPEPLDPEATDSIPILNNAQNLLKIAQFEAINLCVKEIDTEHLLLAVLRDEESVCAKVLRIQGITYATVKNLILDKTNVNKDDEIITDLLKNSEKEDNEDSENQQEQNNKFEPRYPQHPRENKKEPHGQNDTPILEKFGTDLTKAAREGKLDFVVGRDTEIERIAQILSRRKKNNPILIGEPGVGKSAIVEGLALKIVNHEVSRTLFDKRIVTIDMASIVAGTKYRGQFEERLKNLILELTNSTNIILFIDEIHTIVGAGGSSGTLDAANILKPALARGDIQCIGATTLDEYRKNIEKDGALERRFQKVLVEQPSIEESINILNKIKVHYEKYHNVYYTDKAIEACVTLTQRYISDRCLPDKAIDAMDEAGSRVHIQNVVAPHEIIDMEQEMAQIKIEKKHAVERQEYEMAADLRDRSNKLKIRIEQAKNDWQRSLEENRNPVTEDIVAEVIAMMTGVPVKRIAQEEGSRLLQMYNELRGSVIGQDDAIKQIVKAIQRNRAGLKDPNKPIGTFIFMGPTGVGKTELAKVLAEYLFDSRDALIRIDMSEYMEKYAVSRLVGAPPGYVGYEEGGQLTEKVRRKPYSVVLLDEIEKANPDVFNILLQVLDEGHLTDSFGRKVNFKNTIIIMTSNIGSRSLTQFGSNVGFSSKSKEEQVSEYAKEVTEKELKKTFSPEFLNRIDDIIQFNSLTKDNIHKIIDIELKDIYKRSNELNISLMLSDKMKKFVVDKGYDQKNGARPLKRAIQKYIEDPLSEYILANSVNTDSKIILDIENNEVSIHVLEKNEQ
ncbi:MAG: ATP-dependent Clp protease ATP-binding subunit [Bacteroidales bacterium]|nr:ATP-dependent Clp protease ATP-binding subunit [Bacteroidales bacterium]